MYNAIILFVCPTGYEIGGMKGLALYTATVFTLLYSFAYSHCLALLFQSLIPLPASLEGLVFLSWFCYENENLK